MRSISALVISGGSLIAFVTAICSSAIAQQDIAKATDASIKKESFVTKDSLHVQPDENDDAEQCVDGLSWTPTGFQTEVCIGDSDEDCFVRFPSPRPCGDPSIDQVFCEWYPARAEDGTLLKARATIVVHESGSKMVVGKMIAREIGRRGMHAFLVQMPGYGQRKSDEFSTANIVDVFKQGVADARRARDAVAAIPNVDNSHIGIQGTSLGGFVATLASGLDGGFDRQVLVLCGGDLHGVLTKGAKDAKKTLDKLLATGVRETELKSVLNPIEPLRLAHRLPRDSTWLYYATFDTVVPPSNARLLAEKIELPKEQQVSMLANHYSGIAYIPAIIEKVVEE